MNFNRLAAFFHSEDVFFRIKKQRFQFVILLKKKRKGEKLCIIISLRRQHTSSFTIIYQMFQLILKIAIDFFGKVAYNLNIESGTSPPISEN